MVLKILDIHILKKLASSLSLYFIKVNLKCYMFILKGKNVNNMLKSHESGNRNSRDGENWETNKPLKVEYIEKALGNL